MQHRLTWAKVLLQKLSDQSVDVKKITFTDEKRFSLDGPDGTQFYWCAPNSEPKIYGKKTFSAVTRMYLTLKTQVKMPGTTSIC